MLRNHQLKTKIFLAILYFLFSFHNAFAITPKPIKKLKYKINTKIIKKNAPSYYINARYPQLIKLKNKKMQKKFNRLICGYVEKEIDNFIKWRNEISYHRGQPRWKLFFQYKIEYKSNDLISVVISQMDYSGGSHKNYYYYTILFDLQKGWSLSLKELFINNSKYLNKISDYTINRLKARGFTIFYKGAFPDEKNFKYFFITKRGLGIIFPPYQVAPYSEGSQIVFIPYCFLMNEINFKKPLGKMIIKK